MVALRDRSELLEVELTAARRRLAALEAEVTGVRERAATLEAEAADLRLRYDGSERALDEHQGLSQLADDRAAAQCQAAGPRVRPR